MSRWGTMGGKPLMGGKPSVEEKLSMEGRNSRKEKDPAEKRHPGAKHSVREKGFWEEKGSGRKMGCKDFEKLIPDFIAKKMDFPTQKRFYEHVQQCAACREELDIQFLVQEGIQRLEEGNAFDLQTELEQRMEEAARSIRYHSAFLYLGIAMEIVAVGLLAGIVVWILL